jgi:hypothetical protein
MKYTATFMNFASLIGSFGNDAGLIGSSTGGDGAGGALNWTFNVSNITVQVGLVIPIQVGDLLVRKGTKSILPAIAE